MESPKRVVWTEGMLMSPQHLQQQDLYHEQLLDLRLKALAPAPWGVLDLEIDENALGAEILALSSFSGVLPSGLVVAFAKGANMAPPPRPIDDFFDPTRAKLSVSIGVPREREGVANVNKGDENRLARFSEALRQVADLTAGRTAQVNVSFARPNWAILFDDEAGGDYDSVKICEIERDDAGRYRVAQSYVPPCLQIGSAPMIMQGLRKLLGLLATRQRALREQTSEREGSATEFRGSDITVFLQLSSVNAMIPLVQYLADTPSVSPLQTYLILSQLAGQLLTFNSKGDPTRLPKFAYNDLGPVFTALFDSIGEFVATTVIKKSAKIEMKLYKNGVFLAELEDDKILKSKTFILSAKPLVPEVTREKLAVELPKLSKIGTKTSIKGIVQAASNGVPILLTHRLPQEIAVREGVTYFALNTDDGNWKEILNERNIALFMPSPYSPQTVDYELLAVPLAAG